MCELLGFSSRLPATLRLSLDELARHGGDSGPHRDGWGLALFDDRDVRRFREVESAASSALVRFIETHACASRFAVAHIRHATQGGRALCNTQPFMRELGGRAHAFAHNGDLAWPPGNRPKLACHHPIGATDSELAFCALLSQIAPLWQDPPQVPAVAERLRVFAAFCAEMRDLGPANFLYADGDALFVHADRRKQPGGAIADPGVWILERRCHQSTVAGGGHSLAVHPDEQVVTLVASIPLTGEPWVKLSRGRVMVIKDGVVAASHP